MATTSELISQLSGIKSDIRDAILSRGVTVGDKLSEYAPAILRIEGEAEEPSGPPTRLSEIPAYLKRVDMATAKTELIGKPFDDVWVDYDTNGEGDATPKSVDGHPAYYDPLICVDVRMVTDPDGVEHMGAVLVRKYTTQKDVPYAGQDRELASETTAEPGVYYYGDATGAASAFVSIPVETGAALPYDDYVRIYKNKFYQKDGRHLIAGNNDYRYSFAHQYLNSSGSRGSWWTKMYTGQTKPGEADSLSGYLRGCSSELLSCAKRVIHKARANSSVDPDRKVYEVAAVFAIPTITELYGVEHDDPEGDSWDSYWAAITDGASRSNDDPLVMKMRKMRRVSLKESETYNVFRSRSANISSIHQLRGIMATGAVDSYQSAFIPCSLLPYCVIY